MKLVPFDLKKAEKGAKVVTRDNCEVKVFGLKGQDPYPLLCTVCKPNGIEQTMSYTKDGKFAANSVSGFDLFLVAPTLELTSFEEELRKCCKAYVHDTLFTKEEEFLHNFGEILLKNAIASFADLIWELSYEELSILEEQHYEHGDKLAYTEKLIEIYKNHEDYKEKHKVE